jgi:hypothetical protein
MKKTAKEKDKEQSGPIAGAGIEQHGYGGMDTKNKGSDNGKKGI